MIDYLFFWSGRILLSRLLGISLSGKATVNDPRAIGPWWPMEIQILALNSSG